MGHRSESRHAGGENEEHDAHGNEPLGLGGADTSTYPFQRGSPNSACHTRWTDLNHGAAGIGPSIAMSTHVSATAAPVALVRATEASLPAGERLFEDPFAHLFLGAALDTAVVDRFLQVPFMRESIRLRTRYLDDVVRDALADGIAQVVLLGAGFDCRGLRMPELARPDVRVLEVDFAEQLVHKRERLMSAGIALPPTIRHVACDFTDDRFATTLAPALESAGFCANEGALVLWEGVIGYLDDAVIDRTLAMIARPLARPCRVAFNYTLGRFTPDWIAQRLRATGLEVRDDVALDVVHRRLLPGEPPPGGDVFRVCTAQVG